MRKFAISDIHGCAKTFKALLKQINFTKGDELYLLGDYLDRGPDSKGVIDYIWHLQKEGYIIRCLMGNHEEMLLEQLKGPSYFYNGEPATLQSFGVSNSKDIPREYIDWIKTLDYFQEVDNYILVHAGLNFKTADPLSDLTEMIWIRRWKKDINKNWLGNRIIVHGHTPTSLEDIKKDCSNLDQMPVLDIDGGCCFNFHGLGHLLAFELGTQQLFIQPRIDNIWSNNILSLRDQMESKLLDEIVARENEIKVLYFNIEATLWDPNNNPKSALLNEQLEMAIKAADFDFIVCVSNWTSAIRSSILGALKLPDQKRALHLKLAAIFPDKDWFIDKLVLLQDAPNRCKYFDLKSDWYYLDAEAKHYFTAHHEEEVYQKELGKRIYACTKDGTGVDILNWLNALQVS